MCSQISELKYRLTSFLIIFLIQELFAPVQSIHGVIWDKRIKDFVPIFSIPAFAAAQQDLLNKSRKNETHDFKGKLFEFTYFTEPNLIETSDNGTKLSGVIGVMWNTLAEYLNFTLVPRLYTPPTLGMSGPHGLYDTGLLGVLRRNETDIIPRVEAHIQRLRAGQFSYPLWNTRIRLYIKREVKHNSTWMLKLFSRKVWYAVTLTYALLSLCSYFTHAMYFKVTRNKSNISLVNHFMYSFGVMCDQSFTSEDVDIPLKVLDLSLGFYSALVRTAFSALLISYMAQINNTPPFTDIFSLLTDSSYVVLSMKGTLPDFFFPSTRTPLMRRAIQERRNRTMTSIEEMYKTVCFSSKPYALFEHEDIKKSRGKLYCPINPVGRSEWETWIVSGISREFQYKRSLDIGMLKMHEVGLVTLLKQRWIESKNIEEDPPDAAEPIAMDQVLLALLVFVGGSILSFILLIFEHAVFYYTKS